MAYESLRDYFAVNKAGKLSVLYKLLLSTLWPLQTAWNNFEAYRKKTWLISQCKWQIGQLTNLLNYLYDNTNSILVVQSAVNQVYDPTINYAATSWDKVIGDSNTPLVSEPVISDNIQMVNVIIHLPSTLVANQSNYYDCISTIEKIRLLGINYNIVTP